MDSVSSREANANNEDLPEELQKCLLEIIHKYEEEDSWIRKQQIKLWKKNENFWHGVQFTFWSETHQDWLAPADARWLAEDEGREDAEGPYYDYVINIYKAHGESIIAALSAEVPAVRFPPDDADNAEDLITSRVYSNIADLIQKHNHVKQLMLQSLLTLWNCGNVFAYHAPKADKNFGAILIPNYKKGLVCNNCGYMAPADQEDAIEGMSCPNCGNPLELKPVLDGFSEQPKTRVLIDIFGPLFVKVSSYSRMQKECGYLILTLDQPTDFLKNLYPHVADKIDKENKDIESNERLGRTLSAFSTLSRGDLNKDLNSLRRCWLRPWTFESLPESKDAEKKKLYKLYPNGCYCAFVGKTYVESRDEDMDKYWTIGKAGLSTFIHADALGQPLVSINEMRNVLSNLTLETIEQGIPSQFADNETLNFKTYSKHEVRPGSVYPIKVRPGSRAPDMFYEGSRATLSKEVPGFGNQLDKDGQFCVGSFPSIYGGPGEGKSRTAAEYNMSRQMALQRLSICWSLFTIWFAELMEKCVHLYVENLVEDEKFVVKDNERYSNIWIKRAELTGKVGDVEAEGSETFPISSAQKQQLLLKLMEFNNEFLNAAIYDSQNRNEIADVLSFPELHIPGEDQRIKQMEEIRQMIDSQVAIPIEPEIDDNSIHIDTCKFFLIGIKGQDLKVNNPLAYTAIMQHLQEHSQVLTAQTQQQFQGSQPGQQPSGVQ